MTSAKECNCVKRYHKWQDFHLCSWNNKTFINHKMQFFKSWSKKLITVFSKNYVLIHYKIMHALLLFCGKFVTICICYGTAASNYQGDIIARYIEKPRRTVCSSKVDFTALKQKALEIQREVKKIKINPKPEKYDVVLPANCQGSSRNGPQTLRSGEKVFCYKGWTVNLVCMFLSITC